MELEHYLKENNISLADFGARIGVTDETVRRYVKGLRLPSKVHMPLIAQATNGAVTANDFYDIDVPEPGPPPGQPAAAE
jgi:transcriptional regulator with XRE-family HTH domain